MKKIILFFFLTFLMPVFSHYHDFFVEAENAGIFFQIKIRSFENYEKESSIEIISVEVQKPSRFDEGKILFEVIVNPIDNKQFTEPVNGIINFKRGYNLPLGTYSLIINEVDYGFLYIFEDEVFFDPVNCL